VSFEDGLNVIRAENTSGKSALLNGILYALGTEILVGKRGIEATKPVLRLGGEFEGSEFAVVESSVELELQNGNGEAITVRRWVAGERDERLVEVFRAARLTAPSTEPVEPEPYFVGVEGAAQRERGFHQFLAQFLELDLPQVRRAGGNVGPLYVECILPLLFIEQVRGWSGIQGSLRHSFGIRDVGRLAVEYLLDLDVIENERRRAAISEEANQLRENWRLLREQMVAIAAEAGGSLRQVPQSPVAELTDTPWIAFPEAETNVTIDRVLQNMRTELEQLDPEAPVPAEGNEALEEQLEASESELLVAQAELSAVRSSVRSDEEEITSLRERAGFIESDIRRNKDIRRLHDFGADTALSVSDQRCPTCNQEIADTLVPAESAVMSIEENIRFLESERDAISLLVQGGDERIRASRQRLAQQSATVSQVRGRIRDLRSDILRSRSVSTAAIRQYVQLQDRIAHFEDVRDRFQESAERLGTVVTRWHDNRSRYAQLPIDYFSDADKQKLQSLSDGFDRLVGSFGYRSTSRSRLHISTDNYRPICDDFEVAFAASASDNIRLIWAYTLALLQTSLAHGGNHWGLVVFDEPEQQKMQDASSDALYSAIGAMRPEDSQTIVATSAGVEDVAQRLANIPHNLIEFGDKVIRPVR
jgi:predicted  nucleic acid-binding Zn-ribbon protein